MRRALLVSGIFAMVGCGISAVATRDGAGPGQTDDAGPTANLPDTSRTPVTGEPGEDAGLDADSSVPPFPSHINTSDYTLETDILRITEETKVDTDDMSVKINGGPSAKVLRPGTQSADPIAVWSVGPLTLSNLKGNITVTGKKALVIVVNGDLTTSTTITAAAGDPDGSEDDVPGPGGTTPGVAGMSVGGAGQSTTAGGGGGGGGGHATAGGLGGQSVAAGVNVGAGSEGKIMTGTALLGGRGGGNGGRVGSRCGKGGNGGGAIQLSVRGNITFMTGAIIDVSGGGGHGGCRSNGGLPGGGGGGGAGGLIYIEALGDISVPQFTGVVASGGGGGEGGDNNDGNPGTTPNYYGTTAFGGFGGGGGGNGGNGGSAIGGAADAGAAPEPGFDGAGGGGAGGATGRVFFRAHPTATITLAGSLYAESKTERF